MKIIKNYRKLWLETAELLERTTTEIIKLRKEIEKQREVSKMLAEENDELRTMAECYEKELKDCYSKASAAKLILDRIKR